MRNFMFSSIITAFWKQSYSTGDKLYSDADFSIYANPELDEDESGTILTTEGKTAVSLHPQLADRLDLHSEPMSDAVFRQKLVEHKIAFHGADYLFYFPAGVAASLAPAEPSRNVRRLTADDEAAFTTFCAASSEDDLDAAYVELDHWLVFGAFDGDRLVCAASMYSWQETKIADMGVLTLPTYRGKGYARDTVHAISKHATSLGFEPQYRCQLDNQASVSLAKSAGLSLFGTWDNLLPDVGTENS
ncbi:GNAT family N-acetyltransferase [Ochrobactrum sp. SFR4]|nr:GNAT family N-acetyltransferase [Ochrobactrum sp. SFR4]